MSFFKKLFGSGKPQQDEVIPGAAIRYKEFLIKATPYKVAGQYQSCAMISKVIDNEQKEHRFIRADKYSSLDDAVRMIHIKARHVIDEQGEQIFKE